MKTATKKNIKKEVIKGKSLPVKEAAPNIVKKSEKYFLGIGRRKTSTAQARLYPQKKSDGQSLEMIVNGMEYKKYFPLKKLQEIVISPINLLHLQNRFKISCIVSGGGVPSSAGAIRLGISRALIEANPIFKKPLKRIGYLTRDARKKERKKPGLKKARRAPQWQKR
ncbi:30S ribosomal protein S9 [Patescibacteria group bacterium]|nr:30S ribosomal protein S9 [Patescibacteria group bacterium]MBU4142140.1 30S ribosomal protein S9 [Patescibacteria group bacterium]MBU4338265.1 30S ribosomal protein S9 [Patescibacteria group bacterium]MBU4579948.1 30S ribosomal protein S9 [Patescibacteria group bacterium]